MRFAKPGRRIILVSLAIAMIVSFIDIRYAALFWIAAVFILQFFRDPERESRETSHAILAPADGKIIDVAPADIPDRFPRGFKISIFMNIFNVHVNRAPLAGKINHIRHFPGRFLNASAPEASLQNERLEMELSTGIGTVLLRLVAGLIARRIVPYVKPEQVLDRGERLGMIKFGSRVDIYLPESARIECAVGDSVFAGITRIATAPRPVEKLDGNDAP